MRDIVFNERLDDFWVFPKLTKIKHGGNREKFLTFLEPEEGPVSKTNLYIHIPFCDSGCVFCPYYKLHGSSNIEKYLNEYIDAIIFELEKYSETPYLKDCKIESVHFGGGNPFLIPLSDLQKIVGIIREKFDVETNDNWTMEGSINCIKDEEYIKGLLDLGINRISFGVQTFNENIRKDLNIKATLEDIYKGVEILKKCGLTEYCVDLMYNLPNQTEEDWIKDLELVTELDPYHIDIYNMALFPNTYLDRLINKEGKYKIKPSNANNIKMYQIANKWLLEHGYKQIITNTYSKHQERIHIGDEIYLTNGNVLGIGVSSRGYLDGNAYKNYGQIAEYLECIKNNQYPIELCETCTNEQHEDRKMVFFPILMEINRKEIPSIDRYIGRINYLIEKGLTYWEGDTLKLTQEGILWSGNVSTIFISDERWKTYFESFFNSAKLKTNPYNEDYMGKEKIELEE